MEAGRRNFEARSKSEGKMTHAESQPAGALSRRGRRAAIVAAALLVSTAAACSSPEQKVEKYTASGQHFLEEGDLGRANIQFQNALKIDETHVPALVGLSEILEQRQDFRAMFGALQRIVRLDPENVDAIVKLGKLHLIGGDETQALEYAEKALSLKPENADAIALKAATMMRLGDEAGAVELARKARAIDPDSVEAVAVIVTARVRAKDNDGALAEIDEALAHNEDAAVLHLLRLQILSNLGREDDLRAGYEKLIAVYPDTVSFRQMYANALLNWKEYDAARAQMLELVRIQPGKVEPIVDVVRIDYKTKGVAAAKQTFADYVDAQPDNIELRFMFGHFLRQEHDLAGAEAVYASLADKKASEAQVMRARNEIAGVRLLEGKKEEARVIVEEILAKDSGNPDALLKRAGLEIEARNFDAAVADLRTVLASKPEMVAAELMMASAFEGMGDINFATSQFAKAVVDSKKSGETSRLFAGFLMRHGDDSRAEQVLLDSLAASPRDVETLKHLAALRLKRQDWRGAEEAAKLIEAVNKEEPSAKRILGAALTGLEDYSGAIEALTAANEAAPLAAQPLATLVSAFLREGRASDAESLLADMIKSNESNYEAQILLAGVFGAQNRLSEKEQALREAITSAPDRPEAVEALYRLLLASKRFDDAESMLKARLDAAPDNDAFKVLYADLLIATDRREEALDVYADILTRRPGDLLVSNNYASILLELKDDPATAAKALDVARAFEGSDNPYFLDTLGWAQFRNGDIDGAVATLEKTVAEAANFAEAHYHLGAAYLAAGREAEGRASLEKALLLAPQASYAEKVRALLVGQ